MAMPLEDALQNVDLDLNKTYKVQVNDKWVVMRVLSDEEYRSALDWQVIKVVSPSLNRREPIVITADDLTPGPLGEEEEWFPQAKTND